MTEVVNLLLARKDIDVNARDNYGNISLHNAARNGFTEVVKLLLNAGAKVNAQNNSNFDLTPLDFAIIENKAEVVKLLLKAGAKFSPKNGGVNRVFREAVKGKDVELVKLLLQGGAKFDGTVDGESIFLTAVKSGSKEMVKVLSEAGVPEDYGNVKETDCPICLRALTVNPETGEADNPVVIKLTCLHKFHKYCIEGWIEVEKFEDENTFSCPICRKPNLKSFVEAGGAVMKTTEQTDGSVVYQFKCQLKF